MSSVIGLQDHIELMQLHLDLEDVTNESVIVRKLAVEAERYTERMRVIEFLEEMRADDFDYDSAIKGIAEGLHRYDIDE